MEAQPYKPPPFMLSGDVSHAFQQRGWVRGAGGHLYFNGLRTTAHPHLHLIINGQNTVRQGTDIKQSIRMLAWSDGQQGAGGGGRTYLRVNAANIWEMEHWDHNWQQNRPPVAAPAVLAEFKWVMDYFTTG